MPSQAAKLALDYGVAINLGGGFHHAEYRQGDGFCFYADITAALRTLRGQNLIRRALIIDLDAHQGNGHEADFLTDDWVQTFDMYNPNIFPGNQAQYLVIGSTLKLTLSYLSNDSKDGVIGQVEAWLCLDVGRFSVLFCSRRKPGDGLPQSLFSRGPEGDSLNVKRRD
ncbi:histone deacetylase 11-like [Watersipora subatra]|uniref:histone deacetylase 11-like n=1 Tax=Watersipora subatra TaxID=2589382 RepID=UPI00355C554B